MRAMVIGDKARNLIVKPELYGLRHQKAMKPMIKGFGIGAGAGYVLGGAIGAAIGAKGGGLRGGVLRGALRAGGAGAGMGALLGATTGAGIGEGSGMADADKEFLAKKGITYKGKWFPRGFNFTPAAKKKYNVKGL